MVERPLSMREVRGSMPLFSSGSLSVAKHSALLKFLFFLYITYILYITEHNFTVEVLCLTHTKIFMVYIIYSPGILTVADSNRHGSYFFNFFLQLNPSRILFLKLNCHERSFGRGVLI